MPGFFDGLLEKTQNPLFLGGLGLLTGGGAQGMMQGMQVGGQFQDRQRKLQQEEARKQALGGALGGLGLKPEEMQFLQADPEVGGAILKSIYANRFDPMAGYKKEEAQLGLQKTRAEIAKLNRDPTTAVEDPSNIREWRAYQQMSPEQRAEYIRMKRAVPYLDTGPEFTQPNPVDPNAPPRVVPKNLAEAESQKAQGKARGETMANQPKAFSALKAADSKTDIVLGAIRDAKKLTSGWSVGAGSLLSSIPGTQARDLKARTDTILANLGFDELQEMRDNSPNGGALGAIAIQELVMLQSTKASLDQAQTVGQYMQALNNLEAFMSSARQRRQAAYEMTYGAPPSFNAGGAGAVPPQNMERFRKWGIEE